MSGATFGLGDSLINNENPIETMIRYALINSILGMGLGRLEFNIVKNSMKNAILKNPNNKELSNKYFEDYVKGAGNKSKELAEYRRIKSGIQDKGKTSTEYDKIKPIWLDKKEYAIVMHEVNTNITQEELKKLFIIKKIGNYEYTLIIHEYGDYTIIERKLIK